MSEPEDVKSALEEILDELSARMLQKAADRNESPAYITKLLEQLEKTKETYLSKTEFLSAFNGAIKIIGVGMVKKMMVGGAEAKMQEAEDRLMGART